MSVFEPSTAVVEIFPGDYLDRIRYLEARAQAALAAEGRVAATLDEESEALNLAQEHDQLVTEARSKAVQVRLKALPFKTWRQLVSEHPPREGVRTDEIAGVNEETFREALVTVGKRTSGGKDYRTIVAPAKMTDEDLDDLSDADMDRLYLTAFALNRGAPAAPKADLASQVTQKLDEISKSRKPSEPVSNGSGAGSLLSDTE